MSYKHFAPMEQRLQTLFSSSFSAHNPQNSKSIFSRHIRAPFLMRCAALAIDYIIILFPVILSIIVIHLVGAGASSRNSYEVSVVEIVGAFFTFVTAAVNLFFLTWRTGQTIGKWITGLCVVSRETLRPPKMRQILLRYLIGFPISLLTFGLGFFLAAFNKQGRALHDLLSGTIVVDSRITNEGTDSPDDTYI